MRMIKQGLIPDVVTNNILMDGFYKVDTLQVIKLFKQMKYGIHVHDMITYMTCTYELYKVRHIPRGQQSIA